MDCTRENYRFFIETMRRNGENATHILHLLEVAWGSAAPSRATVFRVFHELESGERVTLKDAPKVGGPSIACTDANITQAMVLITENPHITLDELADCLFISHGSAFNMVHDKLHLRYLCAKWIPHQLSPENREERVACARVWQRNLAKTPAAAVVVTDEKWFYLRSTGTKAKNKEWCVSSADKTSVVRRTLSDTKFLVIMMVTFGGKWYFEMVPNGKMVDGKAYISALASMHKKFVHETIPLPWKDMQLIQDNARPHVSRETLTFLEEKKVTVWKQPPYSPDFNLLDRWLFSALEAKRANVDFVDQHELEAFLSDTMTTYSKTDFLHQLDSLKADLLGVVNADGHYL